MTNFFFLYIKSINLLCFFSCNLSYLVFLVTLYRYYSSSFYKFIFTSFRALFLLFYSATYTGYWIVSGDFPEGLIYWLNVGKLLFMTLLLYFITVWPFTRWINLCGELLVRCDSAVRLEPLRKFYILSNYCNWYMPRFFILPKIFWGLYFIFWSNSFFIFYFSMECVVYSIAAFFIFFKWFLTLLLMK